MAYQDLADLAIDQEFKLRLGACLSSESMLKVNDSLADLCLRTPASGADMFMPLVAAAPGFADKYAEGGQMSITDGDVLSAVQNYWARVAGLYASILEPAA